MLDRKMFLPFFTVVSLVHGCTPLYLLHWLSLVPLQFNCVAQLPLQFNHHSFLLSPTASRLPLPFTVPIFVTLVAEPSFLYSSFSFITRRSSLSLTLIVLPFCNFDISHSRVYLFYIHITSSLLTIDRYNQGFSLTYAI